MFWELERKSSCVLVFVQTEQSINKARGVFTSVVMLRGFLFDLHLEHVKGELILNEVCTPDIPLQFSNLLLLSVPSPEVVQKSISDFLFNTCKMVKVHSVLSAMGHFGRGGMVGGSLKSNYASHRGLRKALLVI